MKKGRVYVILKASSIKHQAPSTKRKLGFTLSELLVSLSVLGLIAGLTVPSIVSSVEKSKKKALQKEAVQLLNDIVHTGVMNGDFASITDYSLTNASDPIVSYFTSKLQGIHCVKGNTTFPCNHNVRNYGVSSGVNNHSGRWVLPNGIKIQMYGGYVNSSYLLMVIDTKPQGTPNYWNLNADQLELHCNISQTAALNGGGGGSTIKSGTCGAWQNTILGQSWYDGGQWNSLWQ